MRTYHLPCWLIAILESAKGSGSHLYFGEENILQVWRDAGESVLKRYFTESMNQRTTGDQLGRDDVIALLILGQVLLGNRLGPHPAARTRGT